MERVLVVGARPDSLGEAVAERLRFSPERFEVMTAGMNEEDAYLNLLMHESTRGIFQCYGSFDHVICTAGRNLEGSGHIPLGEQLQVNCWGIAILFEEWLASLKHDSRIFHEGHHLWGDTFHHFLGVSSNSAHLPRSRSAGYCASKAALSMYLRCQARAMQGSNVVVSVAEPGWIQGTPMSKEVAERFDMPDRGLCSADLALTLAQALKYGPEWNGVVLRMDGGER